jgi:hypothetical protein
MKSILTTANNRIHLYDNEPDHDIWLNTEDDIEFTGLCIGVGNSSSESINDAIISLEAAIKVLKEIKEGRIA